MGKRGTRTSLTFGRYGCVYCMGADYEGCGAQSYSGGHQCVLLDQEIASGQAVRRRERLVVFLLGES